MDDFGLPVNALHYISDGFVHALNEIFKQLCVTLSTMHRSVLMQHVHTNQSVKQKCLSVLKDLENTYIELSTGHNWTGVGHKSSVFVTQVAIDDLYADEYEAYAMVV